MLLFSTDKTKQVKTKRKRIIPMQTSTVEFRLKKKKEELGLSKFDSVWQSIQNEIAQLERKNQVINP